MKRLTIVLAILAGVFAVLSVRTRIRARHEAELWAAATAEPIR
ncbi:hypothetical protein HMPREF1531_00949 [Propionibacterium sp. oral taxon 192 str. F0372]|nr:hypothetical protein [Propionibacterium sp. oral taxon 192]EPH05520.1 hypothetical protein HMPREF1531_00949 [Propionibacterium sp. oral taxon 192 str. F0372]